jgi:hypothetical protein
MSLSGSRTGRRVCSDPSRTSRSAACNSSAPASTRSGRSARAAGIDYEDAHIKALLAVDTELNAQGLEVWLKRREKRAAA